MLSDRFTLFATLSDGFSVTLDGSYATQEAAELAAARYMRDYGDPCGIGVHVAYVCVIDAEARR